MGAAVQDSAGAQDTLIICQLMLLLVLLPAASKTDIQPFGLILYA